MMYKTIDGEECDGNGRIWKHEMDTPEKMKLYNLSKNKTGIKINVEASDGSKYILFYHVDGMYSFCKTEKGAIVHLSAFTRLKKEEDGSYTPIEEEGE